MSPDMCAFLTKEIMLEISSAINMPKLTSKREFDKQSSPPNGNFLAKNKINQTFEIQNVKVSEDFFESVVDRPNF
jgi:hypothetical protein